MPLDQPVATPRPGLTKEQKIGFTLLLVFALLTVGLGILQIRNTLYKPFALTNTVSVAVKDQFNPIDGLRTRDTDKDGLSDFDELYVYTTSPYLYDTFSYGMSDKDVVMKGLELCPKGQDCSNVVISGESIPERTVSGTAAIAALGEPPPDILKLLSDPKQVRQMLLDTGTDPKLISNVSDADLLFMVQQILSDTSTLRSLQSINSLVPRQ